MAQKQDYLGKGWSFTFKIDLQGEISLNAIARQVREAILIILPADLGERR